MTVSELIEQLKNYPPNMMVVVNGYEGGYDNPIVKTESVLVDSNWDGSNKNSWYNGRHAEDYEGKEPNVLVVGRC